MTILTGPLAQAIGVTLLHTLWQGAIVGGMLAAVLALLHKRSASSRYAIACGALAVVVLLAVATAWQSYEPQTTVAAAAIQAMPLPDDTVVIAGTAPAPTWRDRAVALLAATRAHVPQILMLWLAGVLILSIRLGVSWWRVQTMARRSTADAGDVLQRAAKRLAQSLGLTRPVRIVMSSAVDVPSVVGWLRPMVLIAMSSVSGLTAEQLEMVLAHELAHIRRHDFLVNAMQSVVETLMFYNPAVWWISREIRIERENCCDDLAVAVCGDPVAYARALAQLESARVPAAAAAANGGSLVERVRRLVGSHSERSLFSSSWTGAAAVTSFILLIGLATAPLFAERSAEAKPQAAGTKIEVTAPQQPKPPAKAEKTTQADHDDDNFDMPEPPELPEPPDVNVPEPVIAPMPPQIHIAPKALRAQIRASMEAARAAIDGVDFASDEESSTTPPGKLSVDDLISLKVQGVTPEYIEQMRAAGIRNVSIRDIISMKIQAVTPDFVRSLAAAGYDHLTAHEIIRLKMFGVNGDFIREMQKYKTNK